MKPSYGLANNPRYTALLEAARNMLDSDAAGLPPQASATSARLAEMASEQGMNTGVFNHAERPAPSRALLQRLQAPKLEFADNL